MNNIDHEMDRLRMLTGDKPVTFTLNAGWTNSRTWSIHYSGHKVATGATAFEAFEMAFKEARSTTAMRENLRDIKPDNIEHWRAMPRRPLKKVD